MCLARVRLTPVRLPGARSELQTPVKPIAGVDLPVAAALTLSDLVPDGRRRLGRYSAGEPKPKRQSKPSARADGTPDDGGCHLELDPSPSTPVGDPMGSGDHIPALKRCETPHRCERFTPGTRSVLT